MYYRGNNQGIAECFNNFTNSNKISNNINKYLLLGECEVRTAFSPSFYGLSAKSAGHENRGSITCHTERASEANRMFIKWFVNYSGKGTKLFDVLTGE